MDQPRPKLDPALVADDALLAVAIDAVVNRDEGGQRRHREVLVLHRRLRQVVGDAAWVIFLEVDAVASARWADLALVIARWAFVEGRRHPLALPGGRS